MAKQISVFLENKEGRLANVTRVLSEANVDIRALSIADTAEFGILRLIVSDPQKAYQVLKQASFTVSETDVLVVEIPDTPGGLAAVLEKMNEEKVNIEYLYAFLGSKRENAQVIFKTENMAQTQKVLQAKGIEFLEDEKIYQK